MHCPDCKVKLESDYHENIYRCPKCRREYDEEDMERNEE